MKYISTLALTIVLSTASVSRAIENDVVQQITNGTTMILFRIDSSALQLPAMVQETTKDNPTVAALAQRIAAPIESIRTNLGGKEFYYAVDLPSSFNWLQSRISVPKSVPGDGLLKATKTIWPNAHLERTVLGKNSRVVELVFQKENAQYRYMDSDILPTEKAVWENALGRTDRFPVQICVVPPAFIRETVTELDPQLPASIGGGSAASLIAATKWISIGFKPDDMTMRIVVETQSENAATEIRQRIPQLLHAALKQTNFDQASSAMALAIVGLLKPTIEDSQIVYSLEDPTVTGAVLQMAVASIAASAKPIARSDTQNNLKQLVLGIHNYQSANASFPTYAELAAGKPKTQLSWRVHILPYIGHAELYNKFKLDEAWDSEHNKPLLKEMPDVYHPVIPLGSDELAEEHYTTYVAPIGEKTIFGQDERIDFRHITDGTSNTIAFLEVDIQHAVPWTAPKDYTYSEESPTASLREFNGKVSTAFMDGSVRSLDLDLPSATWNALFTRNGGEVVRID